MSKTGKQAAPHASGLGANPKNAAETSLEDSLENPFEPAPDTQASRDARLSNTLKTVLKIAFAAGLIYWMIKKGALDFDAFAKLASPGLIAFSAACVFIQIFLNNIRWLALLRGQGFESSVSRTMPLTLIGMFFNFVMPGGVGGDVVKGYYVLRQHPTQKLAAAMSIFMDRMIGFFVMVATAFLALFFNWDSVSHSHELISIAVGVSALFAAFVTFFSLSLSRRLSRLVEKSWLGKFLFQTLPGGPKIKKIYDNVHAYRNSPGALIQGVLLSVIGQGVFVIFVYAIGKAMGISEIPLAVFFFLVPVGLVILALPISPAGIGVGQAAFYFLFSLYLGKGSQLGPTAITVMQVMNFFWGLFGAYFYLSMKKPTVAAEA